MLGRRSNQARLPDGVANWTYAAGMDGTPGHDDMPGQPAPSRGESLWAHAEGSISEDVILAGARERATDIGAGAVTPAVGALLCLLAKLSGGKAVAEVGTGAGVSGLWLLSGMRDDGVLTTIDIEPEHLRLARQAFAEAGIGPSRTRLISGRAQEVLTRLADASYDLVFIDADPIDQPDYVAEVVENGLPPAELTVACDRVQVLTVHAAKGLEWQVVAVAHLSRGVFPSTVSRSSWLTDPAELPPLLRGDRASAGAHGIPVLDTSAVADRKQLSDKISEHRRLLDRRRVDEERRLLYVAVTRAEDTLLVSGHHWGPTGTKPRGPSEFLCELKDIIDRSAAAGDPCGVVEQWASAPAGDERNPLCDNAIEAVWPADPLAARRGDVERGAALVAAAMSADLPGSTTDIDHPPRPGDAPWSTDVDALLAERAHAARGAPARGLPNHLSVSSLVELVGDPVGARQRLMCRLPKRPDPHAWLGDAFHAWVQQFYGAELLFDLGDLPGAADREVGDPEELAALQRAFTASSWAARTPAAVEVPFEMPIGDTVVRGRIDAVFVDPDGGATVVDWKTGKPPHGPAAMRQAAVQLAVYRLAWAALRGCPTSSVRTAFYYVRSGITVVPDELPAPGELAMLLTDCAGRRSDT